MTVSEASKAALEIIEAFEGTEEVATFNVSISMTDKKGVYASFCVEGSEDRDESNS